MEKQINFLFKNIKPLDEKIGEFQHYTLTTATYIWVIEHRRIYIPNQKEASEWINKRFDGNFFKNTYIEYFISYITSQYTRTI